MLEVFFLAAFLVLLFYDLFIRITVYAREGNVTARPRLFIWKMRSGLFASLIGYVEEDGFTSICRPLVAWAARDYSILEQNLGSMFAAFCFLRGFPLFRQVVSRAKEGLYD